MKLSRRIPARTKTIYFNWCKKDWMVMDKKYRDIRKKYRNDKFGFKCGWCGYEFKDGDPMGLAQPIKAKNMVLCSLCCDVLLTP